MTYVNTASRAQLASGIASGATSVTLASFTGWPLAFPYYAIIDRGTGSAEIVTVTGGAGSTLTITRAQGGTLASAHNGGAYFEHIVPAGVFTDFETHMAAASAVHGVSGSVVGTSGAQTLTDKTYRGGYTHAFADALPAGLSAGFEVAASTAIARDGFKVTNTGADIARRAFLLEQSGTPRHEVFQDGTVKTSPNSAHTRPGHEVNTASAKPALRVTNSSAGNATTFEVAGTGNTTVAGTLGVTGASTLTGALGVLGDVDFQLQTGGVTNDRVTIRNRPTQNALRIKDESGFNILTVGTGGNVDASGYLATASTLSATGASTLTGDVTLPLPAAGTTPRINVRGRTGGILIEGKDQAGTVTYSLGVDGGTAANGKFFIHDKSSPVVANVTGTGVVPNPVSRTMVFDDSDSTLKRHNGSTWDVVGKYGILGTFPSVTQNTSGTTTSGAFTATLTGGTTCSTTFVAPANGKVDIFNVCEMSNSVTTNLSLCTIEVRAGAVVGSGTVVLAAGNNQAIYSGSTIRTSAVESLTGLTPGATYNVQQMFAATGGTATFVNKRLMVRPSE